MHLYVCISATALYKPVQSSMKRNDRNFKDRKCLRLFIVPAASTFFSLSSVLLGKEPAEQKALSNLASFECLHKHCFSH